MEVSGKGGGCQKDGGGDGGGSGARCVCVWPGLLRLISAPAAAPSELLRFRPLSSPQHPDLITQPCDSGPEPRGPETDRREGRGEREDTDRERLDSTMRATLLAFINFIFNLIEPNFGGWRFVSNHLSVQFIKYPQRLGLLAEPMGMTQGQGAGTKNPLFVLAPFQPG